MSDPFIAQITMFGGNFAPRGWAFCEGQLLAISQNSALFSILGTTYGGDGRTTFGLPDLRGRFPTQQGNGPGLSNKNLGQKGGVESVTLNTTQIPSHSHAAGLQIPASTEVGNTPSPSGAYHAKSNDGENNFTSAAPNSTMAASGGVTVGNTGGNLSHENMPPFLAINFIIALVGVFPSRN